MAKPATPTLPALGIDISKKTFNTSLMLNGEIVARASSTMTLPALPSW